ncbi:error-prone DNA polymerase [Janibacter melonis]|uniref:error-prone DNA polymerase n=1 Tax=Janibacter melonis TaxID=262209 RepID=UPI001783876F|nr:error-prone DNA polymerase [Janibacter melonis]
MGWHNPQQSWSQLERVLSDTRLTREGLPWPDGGDAPGWSRKREAYTPPPRIDRPRPGSTRPYAELHAHSHFSFLDGASSPQELVEEAVRLGLTGLAVTDHDGLYGAVRLAEAAESHDLGTVFGAELSLGLPEPQAGVADPVGEHLLLLARGPEGYHRLSSTLTTGQLAGEKGRPVHDLRRVADELAGHVVVLTGCRKGAVRRALAGPGGGGPPVGPLDLDAAERALRAQQETFGHDAVLVEVSHRGLPGDDHLADALAEVARRAGAPVVATTGAHVARPDAARLAQVVAAVRARRSLDELDGWIAGTGAAHLRSGEEMHRLLGHIPGAVERTVDVAAECAFSLRRATPRLPQHHVPEGHTAMSWLRELVARGMPRRYPHATAAHHERIERELSVIETKDFAGYFVIVHDIAAFAREQGILHQGRGSAANSAVCYALGITAIDSIYYDLPFERFLATTRDEEPDIDLDLDSDRREEVIQWVYARYGRVNAAQVANVITYRPRSAVRDVAKALGHSTGQQDAWSKTIDGWGEVLDGHHDIPAPVVELAEELLGAPRHLGIHSGGMVLTERPVSEVCPIEPARMQDRTVLQWDKDDCAWMGLVKFDLLGLGMLGCIQHTFDHLRHHLGEQWSLERITKEEAAVYDMLCRADSIGVFQVESRAQIGTLTRLLPRRFYDLVVEIALIRPGPIQGGAIHPYIRRRTGAEPVTYLHPKLVPVLERTMGVPLFQEQLMQMAVAVGGCTGDDADLLRRAMGSKRGVEKIASLRERLYEGMAGNGITGEVADDIYAKIEAFANFGFAESHALSFGLLVYASSWLKLHYPAAFLAGLLRSQPMGFYSPQTLVADARRHGVEVARPCLLASSVHADLEAGGEVPRWAGEEDLPGEGGPAPAGGYVRPSGMESCLEREQPAIPPFDPDAPEPGAAHRRDAYLRVRLGLSDVTGIDVPTAERVVAEREASGPFVSLVDLTRRVELTAPQVEALATAGAFDALGLTRRQALWGAGAAARERPGQLEVVTPHVGAPELPEMSARESTVADLWSTGIATGDHPIAHERGFLDSMGVLSAQELRTAESDQRVTVAGLVTHRQRPATAQGVTFLSLEDETGMINVICSVGVFRRYRPHSRTASALLVRGTLERRSGAINVVADRLERLPVAAATRSRDFR